MGLKLARNIGIKRLVVFGDSELAIRQTMGSYNTKELHILPCHRQVVKMAQEFKDIVFQHISQNWNDFADTLVTLASLIHISKDKTLLVINITIHNAHAYGNFVGEKYQTNHRDPRNHGIMTSKSIFEIDLFLLKPPELRDKEFKKWSWSFILVVMLYTKETLAWDCWGVWTKNRPNGLLTWYMLECVAHYLLRRFWEWVIIWYPSKMIVIITSDVLSVLNSY